MRNIGQFEKQKQDNTILTDFSHKIRKKHQLMQKKQYRLHRHAKRPAPRTIGRLPHSRRWAKAAQTLTFAWSTGILNTYRVLYP